MDITVAVIMVDPGEVVLEGEVVSEVLAAEEEAEAAAAADSRNTRR